MAFMAITMNALPPISAGATELTERLKLTRLEFLQVSRPGKAPLPYLSQRLAGSTLKKMRKSPPVSEMSHLLTILCVGMRFTWPCDGKHNFLGDTRAIRFSASSDQVYKRRSNGAVCE
jgi:hypothetical protein